MLIIIIVIECTIFIIDYLNFNQFCLYNVNEYLSWFLWMIFPFLFCYFCIVCFRKLLFVNLLSDCGWVTVSWSRYKINILIIQSSLALYYLLAFLYQACSNSLYCIFCLFRFEFQKCHGERMPKCNLFSNFNMLLILLCIQLNVIYFVCCVNFNSIEYIGIVTLQTLRITSHLNGNI